MSSYALAHCSTCHEYREYGRDGTCRVCGKRLVRKDGGEASMDRDFLAKYCAEGTY